MSASNSAYSVSLQPPPTFNFSLLDEWPKWRRRFEQFRVASGLVKEDEERQVNTLLYCLGEDADDVLTSTNISDENRKKYTEVLQKFDSHFKVRKNVIFERARFNARAQGEGESIEQYITSLYNLVEHCEYGPLKEEMIRDRLVVGIRDTGLSERLQMDEQLTLDKAKKLVRQREAVKEQQSLLQKDESALDYVKQKPGTGYTKGRESTCTKCGKRHARQACPARDATCFKCNRRGHFGKMCFSKTVAMLAEDRPNTEEDSPSTETFHRYLDAISDQPSRPATAWHIRAMVNNTEVVFKIDTGAEVTAISPQYQRKHMTLLANLGSSNQRRSFVDQVVTLWTCWAAPQCS